MFYPVYGYLVSDDHERLYEMLSAGMGAIVIETGMERGKNGFRTMLPSEIQDLTRMRAVNRFSDRGVLFIDPKTQYNPLRSRLMSRSLLGISEKMDIVLDRLPAAREELAEASKALRREAG